jgi:hypothetical protein
MHDTAHSTLAANLSELPLAGLAGQSRYVRQRTDPPEDSAQPVYNSITHKEVGSVLTVLSLGAVRRTIFYLLTALLHSL